MKKLIALTLSVVGAVAVAGGASSSVDPGTERIRGDGAAPRYVPARAPEPAPRPHQGSSFAGAPAARRCSYLSRPGGPESDDGEPLGLPVLSRSEWLWGARCPPTALASASGEGRRGRTRACASRCRRASSRPPCAPARRRRAAAAAATPGNRSAASSSAAPSRPRPVVASAGIVNWLNGTAVA